MNNPTENSTSFAADPVVNHENNVPVSETIEIIKKLAKVSFSEEDTDDEKETHIVDTQAQEPTKNNTDFIDYEKAKDYWAKQQATNNAMLGGFAQISFIDLRASTDFLKSIMKIKPQPGHARALDCGAGIGRVTKNLLITFYDKIDLLEQDEKFTKKAEEAIEPFNKLGSIFNVGLQEFDPPTAYTYDLIWVQWVLIYLKDEDLIVFFKKCVSALSKNGVIILKENFTTADQLEIDEQDSSVTRPLKSMKKFIAAAGLRIIKELRQTDFPKGLFPVYMIALKPNKV
jgi:protein N-terminal methyltransferase